MGFPHSPFTDEFNVELITILRDGRSKEVIQNDELDKTLQWLCTSPKITSYRINTLKTNLQNVLNHLQQHIDTNLRLSGLQKVKAEIYDHCIPNVIKITHNCVKENALTMHVREIIVDTDCGSAILRGAHIYAPGVMGMVLGTQTNDKVSIYVDISKKCKKGLLKIYSDDRKVHVANGLVKMTREQLFGENLEPKGIAVEVVETISGCPPLGDNFLPTGWALLQNLPSIICVHNLSPKPHDIVLDMCAAPGNKTTHIAELMKNQGILVAIDKTPKKVQQLKKRCEDFDAKVCVFQADSTKIYEQNLCNTVHNNCDLIPPFAAETFDKILVDAPCSVLGKRPQFINNITEKELRSYIPLQRKMITSAVNLLKVNGTLVFSTCTITLAENEGNVAWALKTFPSLELIKPLICLGGPGWPGTTLTEEQRYNIQRFGPDQTDVVDSVGFFIACFSKKLSLNLQVTASEDERMANVTWKKKNNYNITGQK